MSTRGPALAGLLVTAIGLGVLMGAEATVTGESAGAPAVNGACTAAAVRLGAAAPDACAGFFKRQTVPGDAADVMRLNAFSPGEPDNGWQYLGRLTASGWAPSPRGDAFRGLRLAVVDTATAPGAMELRWRRDGTTADTVLPSHLDLVVVFNRTTRPGTAYFLFADRTLPPPPDGGVATLPLRADPGAPQLASVWIREGRPSDHRPGAVEYLTAPGTLLLLGAPLALFGFLWRRRAR